MKSNILTFPSVQGRVIPLDPANRKRRARYEAKKASLEVNPRTFFKLEVIRYVF